MNSAVPHSFPPQDRNPQEDDYRNQDPDADTVRYFENLMDNEEEYFKSDREKVAARNEAFKRDNLERSGLQAEVAFFKQKMDVNNAVIARPPPDKNAAPDIKVTADTWSDEIVYDDDRSNDVPNGKGKSKKKLDSQEPQNQLISAISRDPLPSLNQRFHSEEKGGSRHGNHKTSEIAKDSGKTNSKKRKQQAIADKIDSGNAKQIKGEIRDLQNREHQEDNKRHAHHNHHKKHRPHSSHYLSPVQLTTQRNGLKTASKRFSNQEKPKETESKHPRMSEDLKKKNDKRDKKEDRSQEAVITNGAAFAKTDIVPPAQQVNPSTAMRNAKDEADAQETLAGRMFNLINELDGIVEKLRTEGPNGKSISLDLNAEKLKNTTIQLVSKQNGEVSVLIDTKSLDALTIINASLPQLKTFFHQQLPFRPLDLDIQYSPDGDLDEENEKSDLSKGESKEPLGFGPYSDNMA